METLEIRELISQDWRTDDYIRKQLLCNKLKYCNDFQRHFRLDYNIADYDGAEEKYIKDEKENIIKLKTYLNKNTELIDLSQKQCEIDFDIDASKEEISCKLKYFYHRDADKEELRRKKALVLETFSYEEFRNLVLYVGYDDFENYVEYKNYFIEVFKVHFLKAKTAEELKFLYTNTPEFVIKGMVLENETVFGHLLALTKLDDTGKFSGWSDGSSALVNVLKAFSDHIFLINKFKDNPELCNRIYFNLDGVSEMNGEMKTNRIIFATILMEYCLFSHNRPKAGAPTFRIGKDFKVSTNVMELSGPILGFGQSDERTFFLQQQKEVLQTAKVIPKEGDPNAVEPATEDLEEGKQYFPLEMVYFVDENKSGVKNEETGQEEGTVVMMVPAIYVKALADAENWEEINDTIRIVADMVGIVLGIGTLALSGNPYVLLAAAADLSLALPDLTIQTFREEIAKLPGGEEFLRQWDLIYNVVGGAIALPQFAVGVAQIVVGFYRGCLSLMKLPQTAENVRQGLRAMAISVFLDLNSGVFQRKDLRLFQPSEWVIPSAGFFSKTSECDALVQNGAFFMELDAAAIMENINKGSGINPDVIGAISSNRRFALVYKGEIVAQGSRYDKAYQKVLQDIRKVSYSSEEVSKTLESLFNRRRIVSVEDGVQLGITPEKGIKMSFKLVDEFGNYAGEFIRAQEKADKLTYSLSIRGKTEKLNCFTRLLDEKSAQTNRLPVYGNEKMLMGDFNIPKAITDKYSGLGDLILSDAIAFYQTNKKFGQIDGVIGWWKKATMYEDYGGQSINLTKFWEARAAGKSVEEAALLTFTGSKMKAKGFGKVRSNTLENVIEENEVIINFIKQ